MISGTKFVPGGQIDCIATYICIDKVAVETTSVELAQARPNYNFIAVLIYYVTLRHVVHCI